MKYTDPTYMADFPVSDITGMPKKKRHHTQKPVTRGKATATKKKHKKSGSWITRW